MTRSEIYLIDDDASYTRMVSLLLNDESREVTVLSDQSAALDVIKQSHPDLILLDLHVGERYAGRRILAELRADEGTSSIPVILCSGDIDLPTMTLDPLTDRLQKPFDPEELVAKIELLLTPAG